MVKGSEGQAGSIYNWEWVQWKKASDFRPHSTRLIVEEGGIILWGAFLSNF